MKLKLFFAVIATAFALNVNAQSGFEYVQKGEFGVTLGAGHYFGDLNTKAGLNRPKPSFDFLPQAVWKLYWCKNCSTLCTIGL